MNTREKAAFLRANGWKGFSGEFKGNFRDPLKSYGIVRLEGAFRIASRRKAQREARLLKAAGWKWHDCGPYGVMTAGWKIDRKDSPGPHTRAEALKQLGIK